MVIWKFEKRIVYSSVIDNIWSVDLADMELISNFNKWFHFLLCVTDIYSKYAWVVPLKHKKDSSDIRWLFKYKMSLDVNQTKCG